MVRALIRLAFAFALLSSTAAPGRAQFRKVRTAGYTFLETPLLLAWRCSTQGPRRYSSIQRSLLTLRARMR